jgi:hypothetical protein
VIRRTWGERTTAISPGLWIPLVSLVGFSFIVIAWAILGTSPFTLVGLAVFIADCRVR